MYNEDILNSEIPVLGHWVRAENGFSVTTKNRWGIEGDVMYISDDVLFSIHPKLPNFAMCRIADNPILSKTDIKLMLSVFDCQLVIKDNVSEPFAFLSVDRLIFRDGYMVIQGEGTKLARQKIASIDEEVFIPFDRFFEISISTDWLNKIHPGWAVRLNLALDLDLDYIATLQTVFVTTGGIAAPPTDIAP